MWPPSNVTLSLIKDCVSHSGGQLEGGRSGGVSDRPAGAVVVTTLKRGEDLSRLHTTCPRSFSLFRLCREGATFRKPFSGQPSTAYGKSWYTLPFGDEVLHVGVNGLNHFL
jgi:hypothetical protein